VITGSSWLRVGPDSLGIAGATTIDLGDPDGVPLTLDPLEPEPGFPAATHASLLADVWCAAGRLPAHARDVLTLALLRAYQGTSVPSLSEIDADAAIAELRSDQTTAALVRGFLAVRLGELSGNGLFLRGGHPLDVSALPGRDIELITGALDPAGRALVAGTLLLRLTERARMYSGGAHVLAIDDGESLFGGALDSLIADAAAHGEMVLFSGWEPPPSGGDPAPARDLATGRRSPACGAICRDAGPCTRAEITGGARLAASSGPMRVWAGELVTAFITGRILPSPPARHSWPAGRVGECALATLLDDAITTRAAPLRDHYSPARLATVAMRVATAMLNGHPGPGRAGTCWVPPVLRWKHEAIRVGWDGAVDSSEIAPPLDFTIDGLADWPGIRAGQRLAMLLRHPLSAEARDNRH
jgi:hypothetical protein